MKPDCKAVVYKNMERCTLHVAFCLVEKTCFYLKSIFYMWTRILLPAVGRNDCVLNPST